MGFDSILDFLGIEFGIDPLTGVTVGNEVATVGLNPFSGSTSVTAADGLVDVGVDSSQAVTIAVEETVGLGVDSESVTVGIGDPAVDVGVGFTDAVTIGVGEIDLGIPFFAGI